MPARNTLAIAFGGAVFETSAAAASTLAAVEAASAPSATARVLTTSGKC